MMHDGLHPVAPLGALVLALDVDARMDTWAVTGRVDEDGRVAGSLELCLEGKSNGYVLASFP
jgi:hypothetical protein